MIGSDERGDFGELLVRLRPYVARRVPASDVDDVIQEIFLRMQRGLSSLDDAERFGPWVYRVAQRAVADHFRARARHPLAVPDAAGAEAAAPSEDDELGERLKDDLVRCVALFTARLPSPYRQAVTLTELEGLTQKQASELLGLSLSGTKSRVQRGREQLRRMFQTCCALSTDARGRVTSCDPRSVDGAAGDCRSAAESWALGRDE